MRVSYDQITGQNGAIKDSRELLRRMAGAAKATGDLYSNL